METSLDDRSDRDSVTETSTRISNMLYRNTYTAYMPHTIQLDDSPNDYLTPRAAPASGRAR